MISQNILVQFMSSYNNQLIVFLGEDIAFYFAYLGFYTRWLFVPSLIGFAIFCLQIQSGSLDHWTCLPYAIFGLFIYNFLIIPTLILIDEIVVMIWACFLLVFWRQKASYFSYRWGVLDYEVEEGERPQFNGTPAFDEITGETIKYYPQYKRNLKYCVTVPIIAILSMLMLIIMGIIFSTQDQLYLDYVDGRPLNYHISFEYFGSSSPSILTTSSLNNSSTSDSSARSGGWSVHEVLDKDFMVVTLLYPSLYSIVVSVMTLGFEVSPQTIIHSIINHLCL